VREDFFRTSGVSGAFTIDSVEYVRHL
jgi:hypothetical protein